MPLTTGTVDALTERLADDPDFAAAVDAELSAMRIEHALTDLRKQRGLSQRQLAARLGVAQPVIARIEAGKSPNLGLRTLVRAVRALNGRIQVSITAAPGGPRKRARRRRSANANPR
jgi:DNA-binding XRE family transcriptional regulator